MGSPPYTILGVLRVHIPYSDDSRLLYTVHVRLALPQHRGLQLGSCASASAGSHAVRVSASGCANYYYTILYCTILYYTILYYTILYYTILYYTILYYTILYYTILYYNII